MATKKAKQKSSTTTTGKAKTPPRKKAEPAPQADLLERKMTEDELIEGGTPGGEMAELPSQEADPFEGKLYTTSKWKNLDNFECLFCLFATVSNDTALEHFAEAHEHPPERRVAAIIDTGIVSADGLPITRAVEPAEED